MIWLKTFQYWMLAGVVAALLSFSALQTLRLSSLKTTVAENKATQEKQARELSEKYRTMESKAIEKSQVQYGKYIEAQKYSAKANASLSATTNRLRIDLAAYKRRLSEASSNPSGAIKTGSAGIDNYQQCVAEYSTMAKEYGSVADRLNGLISQQPD